MLLPLPLRPTIPINAPAGSVILFDVSNVHRGSPVTGRHSRHSLTLYFDTALPATECALDDNGDPIPVTLPIP